MCNLVLVLLVALCSTSLVLGENIPGYEEKRCTLRDRSPGVCKPSSECPRSSTNTTVCSTQRGIVYVCCEPTETKSPSHTGTGRTTESPRALEPNGASKTENGTSDDKIADRFFIFDEPISQNWHNRDDRRRVQHNYNTYFIEEERNPFRDIDVDSFEIVPAKLYNSGEIKEENVNYHWETDRRRTERPYNPGYESYEKQGRKKYPWENNQRTTVRPYNPGYESYEKQGRKKYPWENNQRTTVRPYNPSLNYYEENDDQKNSWNSNRRTTERPYNPGYNYYEEKEDQNPWNSNRRTTERPYNPGYNYYEEKEDQNPWNSNRRTTERPYNPGYNYYEEKEDQNPWNSNRRTTERPYNPGYNYYEEQEDQKNPWNSNRRTTERPYNPGYNYYEEKEDQNPWNSNRRTTERPRATRRTTVSSPKKPTFEPDTVLFFSDNEKRKRISKIKCDEYSEIVKQTISGLPLVPNPSPINIKVDECKNFQSLIVGGKNTSLGEFPHMAALGFFDSARRQIKWLCGGSLISDRYVLTAAHCALSNTGKPVRVRLGDHNLNRDDDGAHPEDYTIADVIVHPDYKRSLKYNDIALVRLSERVSIKKDIRPACLYTDFTIPHSTATAIGWGRLHRTENQSDILQKVTLDIIDNQSCRKPYNSSDLHIKNYLPRGIIDSQLCAGDLSGKRDTCQGDSGGPLEILSDTNLCVHYIIGITSFGKSCASVNSPGVYTRVSSYIPWIESVVWPGH